MFTDLQIEKTIDALKIGINSFLDVYIYIAIFVLAIFAIRHWEEILNIYVKSLDTSKKDDVLMRKGLSAQKFQTRLHTSKIGAKILCIKSIVHMFGRWLGGISTVGGARFIVSLSFRIRNTVSPITDQQHENLNNIDISSITTWGDLFATPGSIEQIQYILGMVAVVMLVCLLLGGFFYTLSMNNKVRKNAGQLMFLLSFCVFIAAAILHIYVINTI